jgi:peptidoglycan/LPS O-acetylase OafA/YrhL
MLFFLLSGFCIHHPNARAERLNLGVFAIRRFIRIYPPYLAALAASLIVSTLAAPYVAATAINATVAVKSVLLAQNYPHFGGPLADLAKLQVGSNFSLWSLPVEFELYVAYPLLFWMWRRWNGGVAFGLVAICSLVATYIDVAIDPPRGQAPNWAAYQPTFLHYWIIWCAGAWLAEVAARGRVPRWHSGYGVAGVASLLLAAGADQPLHLPHDVGEFAWAGSFLVLMLWILAHQARVERVAASILRPLARLGDVSYSLYLIHMPVFTTLAALWLARVRGLPSNWLISLAGAGVAITVAVAFWTAVERPSIALAQRLSRLRVVRTQRAASLVE